MIHLNMLFHVHVGERVQHRVRLVRIWRLIRDVDHVALCGSCFHIEFLRQFPYRMLTAIGNVKDVPAFVERVKNGEGRLMGFGHRVYKNYDPRARIIKQAADDVFAVTGRNPLLDIALEFEKIALEDEYFVSRKLYPNVDFYSGLIYEALGMPVGTIGPTRQRCLAHLRRLLEGDLGDDPGSGEGSHDKP